MILTMTRNVAGCHPNYILQNITDHNFLYVCSGLFYFFENDFVPDFFIFNIKHHKVSQNLMLELKIIPPSHAETTVEVKGVGYQIEPVPDISTYLIVDTNFC